MDDKRILVKVAHYYYKLGMTQEEIGKKLSMSRQKVNRIINSLVEKNIVTIQINGYEDTYVDLEDSLEREFCLKESIVASVDSDEDVIDKLSQAAALYLERTIEDNEIIGVSWGTTLSSTASKLKPLKKNNISVVQLVGGTNLKDPSLKADEITRIIASKLNGVPYIMYAPAIVNDKKLKEDIMKEQSIKNIFNLINNCTMAIVGIGNLAQNSTIYKYNYITKEELEKLEKEESVGDICLHPYKINGELIKDDINKRVIGVTMDDLKKIPMVIGIAGGEDKTEAILGALKGGFIDTLITDNITAKNILENVKK